ncbi:MAG: hypothetical protein ACTSPD_07625 [Promethearchaeota archaeon]
MVVVQLDIDESSSGIWSEGANVIVIPKSAFTSTKLNAAIQQAVAADGTVNWSIMPVSLRNNAEISGLDRANAGDETSEWIELVITKKKCSVSDANAILNLLLKGIVNETTCEIDFINLYDDNSQHRAELMSLPNDVLENIPMKDMGYVNDKQGDKPLEFGEWLIQLAVGMLTLITKLIVAIGNFLASAIKAIIEIDLKFVQAIIAAVMALIEAIVKAALLAFIYAFFAVMIFCLSLGIGLLALILLPVALIFGGIMIYKVSYVLVNFLEKSIFLGYQISTEYNSLLDIDVPIISFFLTLDDITLFSMIIGVFPPNFNFETQEDSSPSSSNPYSTESSYTSSLQLSSNSNPEIDILELIVGMDFAFGMGGGILVIMDILELRVGLNWGEWAVAIGGLIATFGLFIVGIMNLDLSPSTLLGIGIAAIIMGIYSLVSFKFFAKWGFTTSLTHVILTLLSIATIVSFILASFIPIILPWEFFEILSYFILEYIIFLGILTFIASAIADHYVSTGCKYNWQVPHAVFGLIFLIIGVVVLLISSEEL